MDIRYIDSGTCSVLSSPSFAAAGVLFRGNSSMLSASRTLCDSLLYARQRATNAAVNYGHRNAVHPNCCDLSPSGGSRFSIDCLLTGQTSRCTGPTHSSPSLDDVLKLRKFSSSSIDMCADGKFQVQNFVYPIHFPRGKMTVVSYFI